MAGSTDYIKWLNRASQDIKMIEIIKNDGLEGMEDSFCYLCHQATEKLLKALVIKEEKSVQKTHDLVFLLGKCGKYHKLNDSCFFAERLCPEQDKKCCYSQYG